MRSLIDLAREIRSDTAKRPTRRALAQISRKRRRRILTGRWILDISRYRKLIYTRPEFRHSIPYRIVCLLSAGAPRIQRGHCVDRNLDYAHRDDSLSFSCSLSFFCHDTAGFLHNGVIRGIF
jgi:hypothetical protein